MNQIISKSIFSNKTIKTSVFLIVLLVATATVVLSNKIQGKSFEGQSVVLKNGNKVVLFYIPFTIETLSGVDTGMIEEKAVFTQTLDSNEPKIKVIRKILSKYTPSWLDHSPLWCNFDVIRLKIVGLFDNPVYVDRDGQYLVNQQSCQLSQEDFQNLKATLEIIFPQYENRIHPF